MMGPNRETDSDLCVWVHLQVNCCVAGAPNRLLGDVHTVLLIDDSGSMTLPGHAAWSSGYNGGGPGYGGGGLAYGIGGLGGGLGYGGGGLGYGGGYGGYGGLYGGGVRPNNDFVGSTESRWDQVRQATPSASFFASIICLGLFFTTFSSQHLSRNTRKTAPGRY